MYPPLRQLFEVRGQTVDPDTALLVVCVQVVDPLYPLLHVPQHRLTYVVRAL